MTVASAVADYFGAVATAIAATSTTGGPANWQLPGLVDGRVKVMVDTYTGLGTEASGKVIAMGNVLPTGANVLAIIVSNSATWTNGTVAIGDYANTTRYLTATALATALTTLVASGNGYVVGTAANATAITSDNQILLTLGGATLTAAVVITCMIFYSID